MYPATTLLQGCLAPFAAGAAVILPKEGRFAAGTFWRDACEHRVTFYTAVPTMHQILLGRAGASLTKAEDSPLIHKSRSCKRRSACTGSKHVCTFTHGL